MVTELNPDTEYELLRACPAVPLAQDGRELDPAEMPPAMKVQLVEERGDRLVVQSAGSTPTQQWRYLVARADFERAITPPEDLPREGLAPTASSNTVGSPD